MKFGKFKNLIVNKILGNRFFLSKQENLTIPEINEENFNFSGLGKVENNYERKEIPDFSSITYSLNQKTKNPFQESYKFLNKENIHDEQFWNNLLCYKNLEKIKEVFFNQEALSQVVSSHTLQLINQKYKNIICQDYHTIEEGMKFLKQYPETLSDQDIIGLISHINQNNYVISELDEQAFLLLNTSYKELGSKIDIQKAKRNSIGHIQQERKWVTLLEEKFGEKLKDEKIMLEIVRKSGSDTFLGVFLTKFFENNDDKNLKVVVLNNLGLLSSDKYIPNVLTWMKNNDLLENFLSNKTNITKMLQEDAYNHLFPLLVEKYNIKPDEIVEQALVNNKEKLFTICWNNYSFEKSTQQKLSHIIFKINDTKLAQDCFKRGFTISDKTMEEINLNPNEAGHILIKSNLKTKMENKYNKNLQKQSVRKI